MMWRPYALTPWQVLDRVNFMPARFKLKFESYFCWESFGLKELCEEFWQNKVFFCFCFFILLIIIDLKYLVQNSVFNSFRSNNNNNNKNWSRSNNQNQVLFFLNSYVLVVGIYIWRIILETSQTYPVFHPTYFKWNLAVGQGKLPFQLVFLYRCYI